MKALISVIVTTYNREDALAAVFRSLAGQIDRNIEVVVAEGGMAGRLFDVIFAMVMVALVRASS